MTTTTTEPCSTGVINELGGCEPVGTEFEPCFDFPEEGAGCGPVVTDNVLKSIDGPATVEYAPAERVDLASTTTVVTAIADPPVLPATGSGDVTLIGAVFLLVAGSVAMVLARWGR